MIRVLFILFWAATLIGQGNGKLSGRITSSETSEGLTGVNVMVKGTYYGAASDADGYYNIPQINPGVYDIEASIIGYKVVLQTGIRLEPAQSITLDFIM